MGGKHGGGGYSNRLSRRKADRIAHKNRTKGGSEEQQKLRLLKRDRAIDEKQRDGKRRKENIFSRMDVINWKRLLDREEMKLRGLGPIPPPAPMSEDIRAMLRRKDFYELDGSHWELKGAAKPARTLVEEAVFNPHERPCSDLFVKYKGNFCKTYEICGKYLEIAFEYAQALRHHNSMKPVKEDEDAEYWFRMCLELGGECGRLEGMPCICERARIGLAATLLEKQECTEARHVLLTAARVDGIESAELLWTTALAIYAEEGGDSVISNCALETAALKNSFIAYLFAYVELFDGVLSLDQEDSRLKSSQMALSMAVAYCAEELRVWKGVEGSLEWVLHFVEEKALKMPVVVENDKSAMAHEMEVSLGTILEQRHQETCRSIME